MLKAVELDLNTALLAFWTMVHLERLPLYLGLGLLLIIFVTYLRVRSRPAYDQGPDEIVERAPGARLLGPPKEALPEAKVDLDFALLSQAAYDQWVWSVQAVIALRPRGKPVEMVFYPDARDFKKWPRQFESAWEMNLDWFDFWLRNVRDPAPEKQNQYERWDRMKAN